MTRWWYLSFVDDIFLGAVVVRASDAIDAIKEAHALKINPGGEVLAMQVEDESGLPPSEFRERLLSKAEVMQIWPDAKRSGDLESFTNFAAAVRGTGTCEDMLARLYGLERKPGESDSELEERVKNASHGSS